MSNETSSSNRRLSRTINGILGAALTLKGFAKPQPSVGYAVYDQREHINVDAGYFATRDEAEVLASTLPGGYVEEEAWDAMRLQVANS